MTFANVPVPDGHAGAGPNSCTTSDVDPGFAQGESKACCGGSFLCHRQPLARLELFDRACEDALAVAVVQTQRVVSAPRPIRSATANSIRKATITNDTKARRIRMRSLSSPTLCLRSPIQNGILPDSVVRCSSFRAVGAMIPRGVSIAGHRATDAVTTGDVSPNFGCGVCGVIGPLRIRTGALYSGNAISRKLLGRVLVEKLTGCLRRL
jgi:hypothetical protein